CVMCLVLFFFFFSSRRRHTRSYGDWSSDVCSSDLGSLSPAPVSTTTLATAPRKSVLRFAKKKKPSPPPNSASRDSAPREGVRREIGRASCREREWAGWATV